MNLIRKGHRHAHRGIIGIEAAIVLIAFVIVAAALAFVVLNMGFSTTQKAKTAIIAALDEAGSALEITGKITATGDIVTSGGASFINTTNIPIKVISGGASANLDGNVTAIKFISSNREYDNIYKYGPLFLGAYRNATLAWDALIAKTPALGVANHPITGTTGLTETLAIAYWTININNNTIIDLGEHVVISVGYSPSDRPKQLDFIAIEVTPPTGAPLTAERTVPNITTVVVDMG